MWIKTPFDRLVNLAHATDIALVGDEASERFPFKIKCYFGSEDTEVILSRHESIQLAHEALEAVFQLVKSRHLCTV